MSHVLAPSVDGSWKDSTLLALGTGTTIGGLTLGGSAAIVAAGVVAAGRPVQAVALALGATAVLCSVSARGTRYWPYRRAQVPLRWGADPGGAITAFAWGAILGVGMLTHLRRSTLWGALLIGTSLGPLRVLATALAFSTARCCVMAVTCVRPVASGAPIGWLSSLHFLSATRAVGVTAVVFGLVAL